MLRCLTPIALLAAAAHAQVAPVSVVRSVNADTNVGDVADFESDFNNTPGQWVRRVLPGVIDPDTTGLNTNAIAFQSSNVDANGASTRGFCSAFVGLLDGFNEPDGADAFATASSQFRTTLEVQPNVRYTFKARLDNIGDVVSSGNGINYILFEIPDADGSRNRLVNQTWDHVPGLDIDLDIHGVIPADGQVRMTYNLYYFPEPVGTILYTTRTDYDVSVTFEPLLGCSVADIADDDEGTAPNGVIDLIDFSAYLNLWADNHPAADITLYGACDTALAGDGVDLSDFACFLAIWAQGCP